MALLYPLIIQKHFHWIIYLNHHVYPTGTYDYLDVNPTNLIRSSLSVSMHMIATRVEYLNYHLLYEQTFLFSETYQL